MAKKKNSKAKKSVRYSELDNDRLIKDLLSGKKIRGEQIDPLYSTPKRLNELRVYEPYKIIETGERNKEYLDTIYNEPFAFFNELFITFEDSSYDDLYVKKAKDSIIVHSLRNDRKINSICILHKDDEMITHFELYGGKVPVELLVSILLYLVNHITFLEYGDKFKYAKFIKKGNKEYALDNFSSLDLIKDVTEKTYKEILDSNAAMISYLPNGMFVDSGYSKIDSFIVDNNLIEESASFYTVLKNFRNIPKFFNSICNIFEETEDTYGNIMHFEYNDDYTLTYYSYCFSKEEVVFIGSGKFKVMEDNTIQLGCVLNNCGDIDSEIAVILNGIEKSNSAIIGNIIKSLQCLIVLYNAISKKKEKAIAKSTATKEERTSRISKEKSSTEINLERSDIISKKYRLSNLDGITVNIKKHGIREKAERSPVRRHNVCGFWRHYKSGKKVWIDPFERGSGEKVIKNIKIEE